MKEKEIRFRINYIDQHVIRIFRFVFINFPHLNFVDIYLLANDLFAKSAVLIMGHCTG